MTHEYLDPASTPHDSGCPCNTVAGAELAETIVRVEGEEGLGKDVPVIVSRVLGISMETDCVRG